MVKKITLTRKIFLSSLVTLLPTTLLFSLSSCKNNDSAVTDEVTTTSGKVKGLNKNGLNSFLGVKYAKANRFDVPKNTSWDGVKECFEKGDECYQIGGEKLGKQSEDCLNLNIWTPSLKDNENLPVYVYIHGGGFGIKSPVFDGDRLAKKGNIVVVMINYRLNAFGFFGDTTTAKQALNENEQPLYWTSAAHLETTTTVPETDAESLKVMTNGSWGVLDQIKSLYWVKNNIKNFGGNPNNVTIGGESAGAMSVGNLILSPALTTPCDGEQPKRLFNRAIMESGNAYSIDDLFPNAKSFNKFKEEQCATIATNYFDKTKDYASQSPETLVRATEVIWNPISPEAFTTYTLVPTKDDWAISTNFTKTLLSTNNPRFVPCDILTGWNESEANLLVAGEEGLQWTTQAYVKEFIKREIAFNENVWAEVNGGDSFADVYVQGKKSAYLRKLLNVNVFAEPTMEFLYNYDTALTTASASYHPSVYLYNFGYAYDKSPFDIDGQATHMSELPFVFGADYVQGNAVDEYNLISNYWISFISQAPNTSFTSMANWTPWTSALPKTFKFGNTENKIADTYEYNDVIGKLDIGDIYSNFPESIDAPVPTDEEELKQFIYETILSLIPDGLEGEDLEANPYAINSPEYVDIISGSGSPSGSTIKFAITGFKGTISFNVVIGGGT